jgi:hypothetical protein
VSSPGRGSSHRSVALLGSLSVVIECLALRDGPRRFRPGSTCPILLGYPLGGVSLRLRDFHPLWCRFPADFGSQFPIPCRGPHDPRRCPAGFRLIPVRSPLLRESRLLSFPPGTEMFQFPGSSRVFRDRRSLGSSPGHFAAFHARILMTPRHPPRALRSLTTPTRRPHPPPVTGTSTNPVRCFPGPMSPLGLTTPRPVRLATGRTALVCQGNDPCVTQGPDVPSVPRAFSTYPKVPRSWRDSWYLMPRHAIALPM